MIAAGILRFARVLRAAGLPVGPGAVLDAVRAVEAVGLENRDDAREALRCVFVTRRDQFDVFDEAFRLFWRPLEPPGSSTPSDGAPGEAVSRRVAEALERGDSAGAAAPTPSAEPAFAASARERLQTKDFEAMSTAELAEARRLLARLALPVAEITTRRYRRDERGTRIDPRATLRRMARGGGDLQPPVRQRRRTRPPPLVVLCDISGSMGRYSRMLLHFLHALTNDRDRVHSFVFGTRLTDITRHLRHRDVDVALDAVAGAVEDWSGGTRIGATLDAFNRTWARRVLGQGAVVLLITDGLDRDAGHGLAAQAERLRASCRRLVWLNPLLRWDGFSPKSSGIRALLPHVDDFRPVHNLNSLAALGDALARPGPRRHEGMRTWLKQMPHPPTATS